MSNGYVNRAMTDENLEPTSPDSDYDELFEIPDVDYPSGLANGQEPLSLDNKDELDESGIRARPFKTIHNSPLSFKAVQRKVFIPHTEIKVTIRDVERSVTTHLLNPNLYTIELKHGDFTWTVCKRYKQFQALHQQLKLFRAGLNIPFPSRAHRERRTSFRNSIAAESGGKKRRSALPRFPSKPEALVPYDEIEHRKLQLQEYLNALLKIKLYKNHHETVHISSAILKKKYIFFQDDIYD